MDFKSVISNLLTAFERERVIYALIGGFAVSLWGYQRATVDIDFLVNSNDMIKSFPSRAPLDMVDIEALMNIFRSTLDWKRIEEYFQLFGSGETFLDGCNSFINHETAPFRPMRDTIMLL